MRELLYLKVSQSGKFPYSLQKPINQKFNVKDYFCFFICFLNIYEQTAVFIKSCRKIF